MERRYGHPQLSDEDLAAISYQQDLIDKVGEFRIGAYEPDYTIDGFLMRNRYELGDRHMRINDAVWGEEYIGEEPYDPLLIELARTPLFRRLQSIEQLTLGAEHATMPNSMYFSRWEHIWGSLVFVRKMTEGDDRFNDRQKMVLQLRTLLSDVGHTAFSHLGDWMFQEERYREDLHDQDLKDVLKVSGVGYILKKYGFSLEETVFPDIEDWVECPAPDLCVDRLDYGFREILRWGAPTIPINMYLKELHDPRAAFEITQDGQLAFKDKKLARYYAAGFSLLPTEHWSHPVHRLQLKLFESAVRASVIDKVDCNNMHPREAMYGIDNDFYAHFRTWPMLHLQEVMKDIARTQRRIFVSGRRADLNFVFEGIRNDDWQFPSFPDPLKAYTWRSEYFGKPYPPNIRIDRRQPKSSRAIEWGRYGLTVNLAPLKARTVDPPIMNSDGTLQRLSQLEPSYVPYLKGQREMMSRSYRASILMRSDVARQIGEENERAEALWPTLLRRQRSVATLGQIICDTMPYAATHSFDAIHEVWDNEIVRTRQLGHQGVLFGL